MTLLSLTECCRLLAIDAKTLRHWLVQAQMAVHAHPRDARIKGLRSEQVRLLARLHHRCLTDWPDEPHAPPLPSSPPPLPAQLLALPETLHVLQAQIAALQQQLADLTHLLPQHAHPPTIPEAPMRQARATTRLPTPPAPKERPTASATKPVRPPVHVLPRVESGRDGQYVVICPKDGRLSLEPDTPEWFAWLATQSSFRFLGQHGHLTVHREVERVPNGAWRAHRQIRNHTHNLRLGQTQDLTIAVLEQAAATLQAHLK